MTKRTFLIADTHFGHENVLSFERKDGTLLRPGFKDADEMDEFMIAKWNDVVRSIDLVYHLGDIAFGKEVLHRVMPKLNGTKRLVRGNHDMLSDINYQKHFTKILGIRLLHNVAFSHVPIHPSCLEGRWLGNAHGHVHANTLDDPRYFNCSVEVIDYTPIDFEEVHAKLEQA